MALWGWDRQNTVRLRYSANVPHCFHQQTCIILGMRCLVKGGVAQINKLLKLGMFIHPLSELARSPFCAKWGWKLVRINLLLTFGILCFCFSCKQKSASHRCPFFSVLWLGLFLHLLFPKCPQLLGTGSSCSSWWNQIASHPQHCPFYLWVGSLACKSVPVNLSKIVSVEIWSFIYTQNPYY